MIVSGTESEFLCQDVDKLVKEERIQIGKAQEWQALNYNMRRRELEIKLGDFVLLEKHWLRFRRQKIVTNLVQSLSVRLRCWKC